MLDYSRPSLGLPRMSTTHMLVTFGPPYIVPRSIHLILVARCFRHPLSLAPILLHLEHHCLCHPLGLANHISRTSSCLDGIHVHGPPLPWVDTTSGTHVHIFLQVLLHQTHDRYLLLIHQNTCHPLLTQAQWLAFSRHHGPSSMSTTRSTSMWPGVSTSLDSTHLPVPLRATLPTPLRPWHKQIFSHTRDHHFIIMLRLHTRLHGQLLNTKARKHCCFHLLSRHTP